MWDIRVSYYYPEPAASYRYRSLRKRAGRKYFRVNFDILDEFPFARDGNAPGDGETRVGLRNRRRCISSRCKDTESERERERLQASCFF